MKKALSTIAALAIVFSISDTCKSQTIYTFAGNGTIGYAGDGGPALSAEVGYPYGIATDASGNVYVAEYMNNSIRKIDAAGVITTIAGTGTTGFFGDGGPASSASLNRPNAITVDAAGNVYFMDFFNDRIRKVDPSGIITTVVGTGSQGYSGDGGPATSAQIKKPMDLTTDAAGNLYIADYDNHRIRKVDTGGTITTICGTGTDGFSGDGGAATAAKISWPRGIAVDANGNVYFSTGYRIRKIDTGGIITTIAGDGSPGSSGDGGPATSAQIEPFRLSIDPAGNLYVVTDLTQRVRKIDPSGMISTIAGNGTSGFSGDGGPATAAQMNQPWGVALDASSNVYIADFNNHRIRVVCYTSCPVGLETYSEKTSLIKLFPNPGRGSFKVQVDTGIENGEFILFNSLGQKVYSQKISDGENTINAKDLAGGLYNYAILHNKEQVKSGKLVID